jgi:hypothetical protein
MSAGWKTLENKSSSLTLHLSEDEDLDDRYKDSWTGKTTRPRQIIYWYNFVSRRRRRRRRRRRKE